jgi:hypothetical protein
MMKPSPASADSVSSFHGVKRLSRHKRADQPGPFIPRPLDPLPAAFSAFAKAPENSKNQPRPNPQIPCLLLAPLGRDSVAPMGRDLPFSKRRFLAGCCQRSLMRSDCRIAQVDFSHENWIIHFFGPNGLAGFFAHWM